MDVGLVFGANAYGRKEKQKLGVSFRVPVRVSREFGCAWPCSSLALGQVRARIKGPGVISNTDTPRKDGRFYERLSGSSSLGHTSRYLSTYYRTQPQAKYCVVFWAPAATPLTGSDDPLPTFLAFAPSSRAIAQPRLLLFDQCILPSPGSIRRRWRRAVETGGAGGRW